MKPKSQKIHDVSKKKTWVTFPAFRSWSRSTGHQPKQRNVDFGF